MVEIPPLNLDNSFHNSSVSVREYSTCAQVLDFTITGDSFDLNCCPEENIYAEQMKLPRRPCSENDLQKIINIIDMRNGIKQDSLLSAKLAKGDSDQSNVPGASFLQESVLNSSTSVHSSTLLEDSTATGIDELPKTKMRKLNTDTASGRKLILGNSRKNVDEVNTGDYSRTQLRNYFEAPRSSRYIDNLYQYDRKNNLKNKDSIKCAFCGLQSYASNLGQLYGPYEVSNDISAMSKDKPKQSELILIHGSCILFTKQVRLSGKKIIGLPIEYEISQKKKCRKCLRTGATITCGKCMNYYHYPCFGHLNLDEFLSGKHQCSKCQ
ncbi:MAG: hypothetical protein MHMPM18_001587 [Marteilia pararefringens]